MQIPERTETEGLMRVPIILDIRELYNAHVENDSHECHHLISASIMPVGKNTARSGRSFNPMVSIFVGFIINKFHTSKEKISEKNCSGDASPEGRAVWGPVGWEKACHCGKLSLSERSGFVLQDICL